MSSELENQIKDDLLKEKFINFLKKYKKILIIFLISIIALPSFYQSYLSYQKKQNEKLFEKYSEAIILVADKKEENAVNILKNIITNSKNETITLLSFHELFKIYNKKKQIEKIFILIDTILGNKNLSNVNADLLKLKQSLLIFDKATESEMLSLLNIKNKKNIFRNISLKIMSDFYISKSDYQKSKNILNGIK